MTLFEPSKEKDPLMATDVEFAITVAARALVRYKATDPYRDVTSALAPVKMGAWPKSFRAALIVGPVEEVTKIYDAVTSALDLASAKTDEALDAAIEQVVASAIGKLVPGPSGVKP